VKLVVDANIIISCLVKVDGRLGELFLNISPRLDLYGPERLISELTQHRGKIAKLAGVSLDTIAQLEETLLFGITIVPNGSISAQHWEKAFDLVKDVDEDDDQFVALALHLGCPLWTGDKKLVAGLRRKGFKGLVTSDELRKKLG
jgi:predicted nucleic acid-binding protein